MPSSHRHGDVQPASRTNRATDAWVSAGLTLTTTSSGRFAAGSRRCTCASCDPSIGHRFVQRESRKVSSTTWPRRPAAVVTAPVWSGSLKAGAGVLWSAQRRPAWAAGADGGDAAREDGEIAVRIASETPATTTPRTAASAANRRRGREVRTGPAGCSAMAADY